MAEHMSIGEITVATMVTVLQKICSGVVGEAAKDCYVAIKNKISAWCEDDLKNLESDPTSKGRQCIVSEIIDKQNDEELEEINILLRKLLYQLELESGNTSIGIDAGIIRALSIHIGSMSTSGGRSIKAKEIHLKGDLKIDEINTESPRGK